MAPRPRDLISGACALLGIITKKRVLTGPRSVALAISDVCDTNCLMCWSHSPLLDRQAITANVHQTGGDSRRQRFMDPAVFETILRESREMGTFRVVLGGNGDPALHPQFDRMLGLMDQLEMEPYVLTNGLSVDEGRAGVWANSRAHFRFSLHAGDEATWLRVHPGASPERFERLCRIIRLLTQAGRPRVSTMHVIHKANLCSIRQMVLHADELGVKEVLFRPVRAQGKLAQLVPGPDEQEELHRQLRDCEKLASEYGIRTNLAEYMENDLYIHSGTLHTWPLYRKIPCYIGWIYAEFDLDGTMRPCLNSKIVMGRARDQRLPDIWFSSRNRALRRESRRLPEQDEPVKGCECDACCMAKFNVNIYNLLHFKSLKYSEA